MKTKVQVTFNEKDDCFEFTISLPYNEIKGLDNLEIQLDKIKEIALSSKISDEMLLIAIQFGLIENVQEFMRIKDTLTDEWVYNYLMRNRRAYTVHPGNPPQVKPTMYSTAMKPSQNAYGYAQVPSTTHKMCPGCALVMPNYVPVCTCGYIF